MINIPKIGMGTFGSDKYDEKTVAEAVAAALRMGYRLFDCASVYGNEAEIGKIFKRATEEGVVNREDLFITSKVWNDMHGEGQVVASCKKTLNDLGLDYIDLYFVHWPFPNSHAKGCDALSRSEAGRPFFLEEFIAVWRQMEQLKRDGLAREIAVSNMTIAKLEAFLPHCEILPAAHEMELHPSFQQQELFDYCVKRDILPIGYCPLGSPNRPERDKAEGDVADTELPAIKEIAAARGLHPAEVCLLWAVSRGQVPIPFASKEKNLSSNLAVIDKPRLSDAEMEAIAASDKNCRLVKGHVFLWNGAKDWRDLWDEDGELRKWIKKEEKFVITY